MLINHIKKEKSIKKRGNSKDIHMFLYGNRSDLDREYEIYDHLKRSDINYKFNTKHSDIERILTSPTLKIQVNQSKPKIIQSQTQRISMVQLKSIYSNRNIYMNNQINRTYQSRKLNSNPESKSKSRSKSKEKEKGIIIRGKSKENYNNINIFTNHTHTHSHTHTYNKNNSNTYIKTNSNTNTNPNINTCYLKFNNTDSKKLNSSRQKQSNLFSTQKRNNQILKNDKIQSNSNEKKKKLKGNLAFNEENKENTHLFTIKSNSNINIMNDLYKLQVRTENVLNLYLKVINQ